MTIAATLAVANSDTTSGLASTFTLSITNQSASSITVAQVTLEYAPGYGTRTTGHRTLGTGGTPLTIAGNSTQNIIFGETFFASVMAPFQTVSPIYWTVSAFVVANDGSTATAPTVQITVWPVTEPNQILPTQGTTDFRSNLSLGALVGATTPNL